MGWDIYSIQRILTHDASTSLLKLNYPHSSSTSRAEGGPIKGNEGLILSRKLTYPLKINGWKMKFPFDRVPFFGDIRLFSPGYHSLPFPKKNPLCVGPFALPTCSTSWSPRFPSPEASASVKAGAGGPAPEAAAKSQGWAASPRGRWCRDDAFRGYPPVN